MALGRDPGGSLENQFLVSMPQLSDLNFNQTVILLCMHNDDGAMGIVINRLCEHSLGDIFKQFSIEVSTQTKINIPIFDGGPVHPEVGLIVHNDLSSKWESTLDIGTNLRLTSSKDILSGIAEGRGPEKVIMSLGYAGWGKGQLEIEIQENAWFTTPVDLDILFDSEIGDKWRKSAQILGIDANQISHQVGHA